jgi:hypothetical protein
MSRPAETIALTVFFAAAGALGCGDATSPAAALVTGEFGITDIAVDDFFLYYAKADGTVRRVSLDGGPSTTILSGLDSPRQIALDDTDVYCATATGVVARGPKVGGDTVTLIEGETDLSDLNVDDTHVYFTVKGVSVGAVRRVSKTDFVPHTLASNQSKPGPLARRLDRLYWANEGSDSGTGALVEMPVDGDAPLTLAGGQDAPVSVAVDDSYIYWANFGERTVKRTTPDGEDVRVVASEQPSLFQVAGDAVNVYWTSLEGTLSMASVDGGSEPIVLSTGPAGPISLVLDAFSIYSANYNAGTVVLRPK